MHIFKGKLNLLIKKIMILFIEYAVVELEDGIQSVPMI